MYTGLQAGVKLMVNYTLGKMAAIFLGPAGLGLLGQFQSLTLLLQNFSNGAIHNGVIKYLASAQTKEEQARLLRTAFTLSLLCGLLCGMIVFLVSPWLNDLFHLGGYWLFFAFCGATAVFFSLNVLLSSVFNALKDYRSIAIFNVIQSLCGLLLFIPLMKVAGLKGALASVVLFQVPAFGIGLLVFRRRYGQFFRMFALGWASDVVRKLAEYSLMTLLGVATLSISQLVVRGHIIRVQSTDAAGLWEGLNRISNFYIFFLSLLISSQMLPRYAEATAAPELRRQLKFNCMMLLPMMLGIICMVYLFRGFLIRFVFTPEFLPLRDLMTWHLAGDFLKIAAWIFSNLIVARKYTKVFLGTDILYQASFVVFVLLLCHTVREVTIAYAVSSALYLLVLVPLTLQLLKKEPENA